jgi:VCBS repeat-containing protein
MAYAFNTFDAWLQAKGFGSYLDGDGELKDGTSQAFFSAQYAAWLNDLIAYYADAIRIRYALASDTLLEATVNQNDTSGLPAITGLTAAQVDQLFDDTSDFSWTSGSARHLIFHERYYSNSFNFALFDGNQAPIADAVAVSGVEDAPSIAVVLTGSDPDLGDTVESFTLTSLPSASEGVLYADSTLSTAVSADAAHAASSQSLTLYFVPTANFNGEVSFTYTASDGLLSSAAESATIQVAQVNDPASFGGQTSGSGDEDGGPIVGTLTVSDDADGVTTPNFRIASGDTPAHGGASIDAITGQWSYMPDADFNGTDHFTVSVTDDDGNVETQVIDIAVSPVADPPVAHDDAFTATEDFGASGNVLANDSNPDNEPLTVVALSGVRDADSPPRIVITEIMANPAVISDADGEWFEVYNAGAAPVDFNGWTIQIGNNSILVDSPTPLLVAPGGFFVFAANPFFVFPANYITGPLGLANGGTTIALFDPDGSEIDSVNYSQANEFPADVEGHSLYLRDVGADNNDGLLWEATPNAFPYDLVGNLGTPGIANPIFGGAAGIGDPPVVDQPAVFLSGALLTLNADGAFVFDTNHAYDFLAEGQSWINQFAYTLSNGQTANVILTTDGANDAPAAHDDDYAALEDVPLIGGSVFGNDSDVDQGTLLTASLVDSTSHGSLTFNADGTFTYVPDSDFFGTDSFTYLANDGFVDSNVATVTILVAATNDAPIANDDSFTTSSGSIISGNVLTNDTDIDGDLLTVSAIVNLAPVNVVPRIVISEIMDNPNFVSDADGEWFEVYNIEAFPVDLNGWTIQIGSRTILVDSPSPLVVAPGSFFVFAANADSLVNGGIPFVGYAAGPLGLADSGTTLALFDGEGNAIDSVNYGQFEFPPDLEGRSIFLRDAGADNNIGSFWENSPNSGPFYGFFNNSGTPGQVNLIFGGGAGASPPIGEQVTLNSGALLTLNADGTFDYDPNGAFDFLAAGDRATDGFAYTASDGHGGIDTAVVTITIQTPSDPLNSASYLLL